MKKTTLAILILALLSACSFNNKEIIILKTIDQFDSQEENVLMGQELLRHPFDAYYKDELGDLSPEEFSGITYQYFITDKDKTVSFRLILTNDALNKKDRIVNFFEGKVNQIVDLHLKYSEELNQARTIAKSYCELLDKQDYATLWDKSHSIINTSSDLKGFKGYLNSRSQMTDESGNREYYSNQVFEGLPQYPDQTLMQICFNFENKEDYFERFTMIKEDGQWLFAGYNYWIPNK
jgi:hypothetical protein